MKAFYKLSLILVLILLSSCGEKKESLRIAVASNFAPTLEKIAIEFTKETGILITIIPGSTGKLFTQIQNGAPYDVFLAADQKRPQELDKNSVTYAIGKLVLWGPGKSNIDFSDLESDIKHIAIANPKLAPYGQASRETLKAIELWDKVNFKLVIGENIIQAYHYAKSGNTEFAFIAKSQVQNKQSDIIEIPENLYNPIKQDACIVNDSENSKKFMTFLQSSKAKEIILESGYGLPSAK